MSEERKLDSILRLQSHAEIKDHGANGSTLINGTGAVIGNFYAIQAMTADVTVDVSGVKGSNISWAADFVLPIGPILFGDFTQFQLTAGTVIAYHSPPA